MSVHDRIAKFLLGGDVSAEVIIRDCLTTIRELESELANKEAALNRAEAILKTLEWTEDYQIKDYFGAVDSGSVKHRPYRKPRRVETPRLKTRR